MKPAISHSILQAFARTATRRNRTQYRTKETEELAVMVDTFKPLQLTEDGEKIADGTYYQSWINE